MGVLYYTKESKEELLKYLNNRFWEIINQFDYDFSLFQLLKFSKFSNRKVFKTINIILLGLTIFIWLIWLKIGYKADTIVRVSMVLFVRCFWLMLKIAIFFLDKPLFKAEIRENGIIIYYRQNVGRRYDLKEISNMDMEKYYDDSIPSIKFTISDKDWLKHYYYRPSDDIIEKFCNDSILYYKKKYINTKIPIDNREPISYETNNSILDYWLLLSDDEKGEVKKYLRKWILIWLWISLFVTIMISSAGDDAELSWEWSLFAFSFFFGIFFIIHITTLLKGFKSPTVEIKENMIIIDKPNLSHDYIKCSSITDAKYKYFKKNGIEWIKLAIVYDWKGSAYTWLRSERIEEFCKEVIDIANNNKSYYSKINSSD